MYYYLGVFVNVYAKFNFPWCPETMPVDNRTGMVYKSYRRLALYNTFLFVCCCYCLFVVCVMHFVITSSLYCCMCAILHKKIFTFYFWLINCVFICFLFMFFFFFFFFLFFFFFFVLFFFLPFEVVCGRMIVIVELLCSWIGTFFYKVISWVIRQIYFMQVWYCSQPIFVLFLLSSETDRLAHYGQKVS